LRIKNLAQYSALRLFKATAPNSEDYQEPLEEALTTANNSNPFCTKNIPSQKVLRKLLCKNTLDDHSSILRRKFSSKRFGLGKNLIDRQKTCA